MFGYQTKSVYELNTNGSYSESSVIEKDGKQYCIASSSFHHIGAAPGSYWEIINREEDYSPCNASNLVETEEELFIPRWEFMPTYELSFSTYQEMVEYWNTNSKQVGSRNGGCGVELVFSL